MKGGGLKLTSTVIDWYISIVNSPNKRFALNPPSGASSTSSGWITSLYYKILNNQKSLAKPSKNKRHGKSSVTCKKFCKKSFNTINYMFFPVYPDVYENYFGYAVAGKKKSFVLKHFSGCLQNAPYDRIFFSHRHVVFSQTAGTTVYPKSTPHSPVPDFFFLRSASRRHHSIP